MLALWIFLSIFVLMILIFILLFSLGIRAQAFFDLKTARFCADVYLFGKLHVLKFSSFCFKNGFYYQFNRGDLKRFERPAATEKPEKDMRPQTDERTPQIRNAPKKAAAAEKAYTLAKASLLPLPLRRAEIAVAYGATDPTIALAYGGLGAVLSALGVVSDRLVRSKEKNLALYPLTRENFHVNADFVIGWGALQIFYRLMRIIRTKRRLSKYGG